MKKKVIILGSLGMAGHVMAEVLDTIGKYNIFGIARSAGKYVNHVMDVTNFEELKKYIEKTEPDYIVNCIGALVSQSQNDLPTAILLNSYLPNYLSKLGNQLNYKFIHISTDCVFSGKDGGYTETSFRDGDDNYARTKALGEIINEKDLTIRTSIIGPELKKNGTGLLDWVFKQKGLINGYTKAYWSGVTTLELAKATLELIEQEITGLYQLCPKDKISKFNLLKLFAIVWDRDIKIIPFDNYNVDKSLVCTRNDFNYPAPKFEKMLEEMKNWMKLNASDYTHYKIK